MRTLRRIDFLNIHIPNCLKIIYTYLHLLYIKKQFGALLMEVLRTAGEAHFHPYLDKGAKAFKATVTRIVGERERCNGLLCNLHCKFKRFHFSPLVGYLPTSS